MSARPRTGTHAGPGKKPDPPGPQQNRDAAEPEREATLAGVKLPFPAETSKRALWWGGLATLAAVGVLEWPVAVVVGAGTYVAERLSLDDVRKDLATGD
ncbi:hypothetical protein [Amycolatopsis orientalis]|uniref:hypothetical protein n=1 Tax=Amycolatopsis orientalis TaxID=31958 RepID=UPI0003AAEE8F|nr:hypothetical protein [Amycolatopsis orientalis]